MSIEKNILSQNSYHVLKRLIKVIKQE